MRRDDRIWPMGDSYAIVVFWVAACGPIFLAPYVLWGAERERPRSFTVEVRRESVRGVLRDAAERYREPSPSTVPERSR